MLLCVYSLINLLILCNYLLIDLLIFSSFDHLFLQSTSCGGYNIFNIRPFLNASQSVRPGVFFLCVWFFLSAQLLWNSWNFLVMMDILCRKIWRWIWNLFNERDKIFLNIFSRMQGDVDNKSPNVSKMWQLFINYLYPIITHFSLWFSV